MRRQLEGSWEIICFLEAFLNSINLTNQILHSEDTIFTTRLTNQSDLPRQFTSYWFCCNCSCRLVHSPPLDFGPSMCHTVLQFSVCSEALSNLTNVPSIEDLAKTVELQQLMASGFTPLMPRFWRPVSWEHSYGQIFLPSQPFWYQFWTSSYILVIVLSLFKG